MAISIQRLLGAFHHLNDIYSLHSFAIHKKHFSSRAFDIDVWETTKNLSVSLNSEIKRYWVLQLPVNIVVFTKGKQIGLAKQICQPLPGRFFPPLNILCKKGEPLWRQSIWHLHVKMLIISLFIHYIYESKIISFQLSKNSVIWKFLMSNCNNQRFKRFLCNIKQFKAGFHKLFMWNNQVST